MVIPEKNFFTCKSWTFILLVYKKVSESQAPGRFLREIIQEDEHDTDTEADDNSIDNKPPFYRHISQYMDDTGIVRWYQTEYI